MPRTISVLAAAFLRRDQPGPSLNNCVFLRNSGGEGGAVYYEPPLTAINCRFEQNTAAVAGNFALGGGAVLLRNGGVFYNCLFVSNTVTGMIGSYTGGAIVAEDGNLSLFNCTLAYNLANLNYIGVGHGGAVGFSKWRRAHHLELNLLQQFRGQSRRLGGHLGKPADFFRSWRELFRHSQLDIRPRAVRVLDFRQQRSQSLFRQRRRNNFQLLPYSPAVDAGGSITNNGGYPSTDLLGQTRITGSQVDLGAYEFQNTPNNITGDVAVSHTCDSQGSIFTYNWLGGVPGQTAQWQVDHHDGQGFQNLSDGGVYSQTTTIALTITHPPASYNGYTYRILAETLPTFNGPYVDVYSTQVTLQLSGTRVYVNAAAHGANDGSSWANAFPSLTTALNTVGSCCQIWVAAGTYTPGATPWAMRPDVSIYGGFAGTETDLSQRNPRAHPTILSGPSIFVNNGAQHGFAAGPSAILDGFILTGAQVSAIINITASPTIQNCVFAANTGSLGAAILCQQHSSPYISSCIFSNNTASEGSAIWSSGSSPAIVNCLFENNRASYRGAALAAFNSSVTVVNSTIAQNTAGQLCGGLFLSGGTNMILNSILWNNTDAQPAAVAGAQLSFDSASTTTVANTDWQGLPPLPITILPMTRFL